MIRHLLRLLLAAGFCAFGARAAERTTELLSEAEIKQAGGATAAAPAASLITLPPMPPGPFQATWESLRDNHREPQWFLDAKFGLSMHWGLYSAPARQSEWYVRYMYGGNAGIMRDHIAQWGPLDKFG